MRNLQLWIKVEPYWNVKRIEAFMEAVESELK